MKRIHLTDAVTSDKTEAPSQAPGFDALVEAKHEYLDRLSASQYLRSRWGIFAARQTLARWLVEGTGPPVHYDGRFPRYMREDLDLWATRRLRGPYQSTMAAQFSQSKLRDDDKD